MDIKKLRKIWIIFLLLTSLFLVFDYLGISEKFIYFYMKFYLLYLLTLLLLTLVKLIGLTRGMKMKSFLYLLLGFTKYFIILFVGFMLIDYFRGRPIDIWVTIKRSLPGSLASYIGLKLFSQDGDRV